MGQFQMVTFQDSIQQGAVEFRLFEHLFDARAILLSQEGVMHAEERFGVTR
jgi:hypothetical protein